MIKSKISDLDKDEDEEQKRAVRSGYDMDVLPSDLVTYGEEAKTCWKIYGPEMREFPCDSSGNEYRKEASSWITIFSRCRDRTEI